MALPNTADPDRAREAMVAALVADGAVCSASVAATMRTVPREAFVPEVELTSAYDPQAA